MKLKIFSMLCISLNLYIFDDKIVYTKPFKTRKLTNYSKRQDVKNKKGNIKKKTDIINVLI